MLYIYSSSKLNFLHNVEMADIGSKNAHLFFLASIINLAIRITFIWLESSCSIV